MRYKQPNILGNTMSIKNHKQTKTSSLEKKRLSQSSKQVVNQNKNNDQAIMLSSPNF